MKVWRKVKMETFRFQIGDQIKIKVKGLGKYTATVHKVDGDRALFIFDQCVADRPMNENNKNEGGFVKSDLCKWLNEEFVKMLPDKVRSRIVADDEHSGLMIRIPTRGEMFGANENSEYYEVDSDAQLLLMKDRKNRICMSPDDEYCWYWLMNARRDSATSFARVAASGSATDAGASYSYGVRPAFVISDL